MRLWTHKSVCVFTDAGFVLGFVFSVPPRSVPCPPPPPTVLRLSGTCWHTSFSKFTSVSVQWWAVTSAGCQRSWGSFTLFFCPFLLELNLVGFCLLKRIKRGLKGEEGRSCRCYERQTDCRSGPQMWVCILMRYTTAPRRTRHCD